MDQPIFQSVFPRVVNLLLVDLIEFGLLFPRNLFLINSGALPQIRIIIDLHGCFFLRFFVTEPIQKTAAPIGFASAIATAIARALGGVVERRGEVGDQIAVDQLDGIVLVFGLDFEDPEIEDVPAEDDLDVFAFGEAGVVPESGLEAGFVVGDVSEFGLVRLDFDIGAFGNIVLQNDRYLLALRAHQIIKNPLRNEHRPRLRRKFLNPHIRRLPSERIINTENHRPTQKRVLIRLHHSIGQDNLISFI